jgi:DNA-binding NtrC family response regulator
VGGAAGPSAAAGATAVATVDAWLATSGVTTSAVGPVAQHLTEAGVRLRSGGSAPPGAGDGVLVFEEMTGDLADHVRQLATGAQGRVLALSLSGHALGDESWQLLRAGASDVVTWGDPARSARHVALRLRRWKAVDELTSCPHVREFLVGDSQQWRAVLREAVEAARFTDAPVLVTGETGTGKERVAQLIHELDPRPGKKDFVVLDCSTVVPSLSGSEFFGHEKGAFTGAATARAGAFELANGGTLFLDEVGELPVTLQAELLRVIQEGTFKRVGSSTWRRSDFRLVCATNRDLAAEQSRGTFRRDFYHRIAGCTVDVPSLRHRREDILLLFRHFFGQQHPDGPPPELDDAVRDLLLDRAYPGNVRDLRSLAVRISHRHLGQGFITVGDVPDPDRPGPEPPSQTRSPWAGAELEDAMRRALARGATLDDITAAAARTAAEPVAGAGHAPLG